MSDLTERLRDEAYDKIDRFLRNNLDDADYAVFSEALESVYAADLIELALGKESDALRGVLKEARKNLLSWCDCHDIMPDETAEIIARIDAALGERT